jgi:hypothetical protein
MEGMTPVLLVSVMQESGEMAELRWHWVAQLSGVRTGRGTPGQLLSSRGDGGRE